MIGIKKSDSVNSKFRSIIKAQEHLLSKEGDGIGALIVDKNNNIQVRRHLQVDEYGQVYRWVQDNASKAKIVAIHTRQATDGGVNERNIHFYKIGNYYMAHNGIIGEYSGYNYKWRNQKNLVFKNDYPAGKTFRIVEGDEGMEAQEFSDDPMVIEQGLEKEAQEIKEMEMQDERMSDSYQFLRNIPKPITKAILAEEADKKHFMGVGVIFNEMTKKMFVISTREMKAHTDLKNMMFSYSYEPENVLHSYQNVFGFKVMTGEKEERLKTKIVPAGIYEIDFAGIKVGK